MAPILRRLCKPVNLEGQWPAQKDPERLERWLEKAASAAAVVDEPS
jgi:hypothetical protein